MRSGRRRDDDDSAAAGEPVIDEKAVTGAVPETEEEAAFRLYADVATVIVRWTPDARTNEPRYSDAVVGRFAVGGSVPFESMREPILRWLLESGEYPHDRHFEVRRHTFDEGASGAEAILVLTLLGGAAGGIAGKLAEAAYEVIRERFSSRVQHIQFLDSHLGNPDGLRWAVASALGTRGSDLRLIEQRTDERRVAAAFEAPGGEVYGARLSAAGVTIRRLKPGEY